MTGEAGQGAGGPAASEGEADAGPAPERESDREMTVGELRDEDGFPDELAIICDAALERNARDPVILDLRGLSDATDFFVVASGDSDVHARAIAEMVREGMDDAGFEPVGVEGGDQGRWILVDYFNVVVHLFVPRVRDFYRLERLWGDAPQIAVRE